MVCSGTHFRGDASGYASVSQLPATIAIDNRATTDDPLCSDIAVDGRLLPTSGQQHKADGDDEYATNAVILWTEMGQLVRDDSVHLTCPLDKFLFDFGNHGCTDSHAF